MSCKAKGGGGDRASLEQSPAPMNAGSSASDEKAGKGGKDDKAPTTWKRSQIVPNSSRVMVGDRDDLTLRTMQTHVSVDGFRARVVIDYVYANEHDRQLEGSFQLRLPEGASPYYFAFGETKYEAKAAAPDLQLAANDGDDPKQIAQQRQNAWLAPKEARMVPRETAAIAYGQTVRRRVDPALVEWAGAGVFTARVYPLAPRKLHRIVVGYDLDLTPIGNDLEMKLDLPEQVPQSVVDISVAGAYTATSTPAAQPATVGTRKVFHYASDARSIAIRLSKPGSVLLVDLRGDSQTGEFFASRVMPELPSAPAATTDAATFLVDTSLSSNPDRFNIYLKLLRAVLEKNRDSLKVFNVMFFSVDAHWYKHEFIANTSENVDALIAFANTLALEGATDLGAALGEAARPTWNQNKRTSDMFLLSDGAATWGQSNLHALGKLIDGAGALYAYQTGLAGTDTSALVHLARDSGGAVFSVTGEAEIDKAATAHRARPWRLVGVSVTGGTDVLVAGNPTVLFPGQSVYVVGRGQIGATALLSLTVEQGGTKQVVKTKLGAPLPSPLAARTYGSIATAHLEELETATEAESRAYATHFRITGRTVSLLMLETEADYERFGIKPDADAYVVKATPAAALFAKALAATIGTLGDPKAAFLSMIDKLGRSPHVKLNVPGSYKTAIDGLPAAVFAVPATPLATKLRASTDLAPGLIEALATHKLEYDAVSAAALARRAQGSPADVLKALSSLV
ncbi:MAG: VWA domain-containing protein, partial [Deltaproteobacteria bacterium]|nr:VWA domain-containing protein [Deltaproteobacteria bacterium]